MYMGRTLPSTPNVRRDACTLTIWQRNIRRDGEKGHATVPEADPLPHDIHAAVAGASRLDPSDPEGIWSIWDNAEPGERSLIVDLARTVTKTGT